MTLHLIKLCVGVSEPKELVAWQKRRRAERRANGGKDVIYHVTRFLPKRGDEIAGEGSIYWVMKGVIRARQRILGFDEIKTKDGVKCGIRLHSKLIRVLPRACRAFQGWRYLEAADAPPDLDKAGKGIAELPPKLAAELRALGLL